MKVKIKYKDTIYEYEKGIKLKDIASDFQTEYNFPIIVGSIDNMVLGLNNVINKDCVVDFYDITSAPGSKAYERGLLFLFSKSVRDILNCDVMIQYMANNDIYSEILSNDLISEVTVEKIRLRMKELVKEELPISKLMVSRLDAIDYFNKINQIDKAESLNYISNSTVSLHKLDDTLDYYYGSMPDNTRILNKFNLKFVKNNKVVLMLPNEYSVSNDLKYNKNEKLLDLIVRNDNYLNSLEIKTSVDFNKIISNGNFGEIMRLTESIQNNRLFEISEKISKDKDIKVILITGPSSSGKTTTSKKITLYLKGLGLNTIPISIDDFYTDMDKRVKDENGNPEFERISAIDTKLFNKVISELLDGKEVNLPIYNFASGKQEVSKDVTKLGEKTVLVVEGIHAFHEQLTEMIPDKNKFKIFIAPLTPLNIDNHNIIKNDDNRLLRRIIRDNRTRDKTSSETLALWHNVRKAEEEMLFPYMKDADEIFNTNLIYELSVLKTYAEPLLFSVSKDDPNYIEALRLINLFRVILAIPSDEVPSDSLLREFIGGSCFKV